jgi:type I restriction enzyme S subunit
MIETKFKQTEIGLIPEDWKVFTVGKITQVSSGGTPNTAIPSFWGGDIPWMNSGELNLKIVNNVSGRITNIGLQSSSTHWIPEKCILIGLAGQGKTRGTAAYNTVKLCTNQSIAAIYPCDIFDSKFEYYYFDSQYDNLRQMSEGGGGRGGLTKSILTRYYVPIPSLAEQQRIASALTSIDNLLSSLDKLIAKKRDIKQGAMQQLLTSKTRLNGFNAPWVKYKIDDLFDIGNGYTPSKANPAFWNNGTIPWFRMEDIRTNGRILRDSIQHVTPAAVKSSGLFPAFSIILSTTATIGEHALLIADSLANQRFSFLIRKLNRCSDIDIWYFFYHCFILGDWCRANINDGGLMAVNINDLKNYTFEVPSTLKEQQAIASVLSSMDNEIAALEAKRKKYKAVKQGMMQQLLTGKIRLI